eukprot:TRINITY_DN20367_c0_g1_i1.p1 TRINITY_DN20367_c0_g1~~TRINITY_DN20367_c0_g1_i1.p1  ORF type:complete len:283 (+),score=67.36 TRINITY_DN20367_c0_g1_i1:38-886(+)
MDKELTVAILAANEAGKVILKGWGDSEELNVSQKSGCLGDLQTSVDISADKIIQTILKENFPDDAIMSEELNPDYIPNQQQRTWIVDPMDGTSCFFFHAEPALVSVLIALMDANGTVTHGVCYHPISKDLFYAIKGQGSFLNGEKLTAPSFQSNLTLAEAWVDVNHYSDVEFETANITNLRTKLRTKSSGARLVTSYAPASGRALQIFSNQTRLGALVHDNNSKHVKQATWDTAAIQLIVEEAGGFFLSGTTGTRYNCLIPDIIIATASQSLSQSLLDLLKI